MLNGRLQKQTLVGILAVLAAGGAAAAADMRQPDPAPAAEPEAAAETGGGGEDQVFRDWRVACEGGACAAYTRIDAVDGTEVLRVELAGEPPVLRFVTSLGLHLPDGLVATIGEGAESGLERAIPWRTCAPARGCIADAPADSELLTALRREQGGMAAFTLVEGVPVRLGFSLMGFAAARAALAGVSPDP